MSGDVFIIAEAGVNHNGQIDMAKRLIEEAADAGADAIKFQTFRADLLVSRSAAKAEYQKRTTGGAESQHEMLRKLELTETAHEALIGHAAARGITFLSTPFDQASLELLTGRFNAQIIKVSSGDVTNAPLLLAIARSARKVILSTGMCSLAEIEAALGVLAFGFTASDDATPSEPAFAAAYASAVGQAGLRGRVTILHCTSEYPAAPRDVNLRAMDTIATAFGLPIGYSDHTLGIHIALAAAARGAQVIEKHLTLDRATPGPDHAASIEPNEFRAMVTQIREISVALGDGIKRPAASEAGTVNTSRKSLVASRAVAAGENLSHDNVTCKRPGSGSSPFHYWRVVGTRALRSYEQDEPLDG